MILVPPRSELQWAQSLLSFIGLTPFLASLIRPCGPGCTQLALRGLLPVFVAFLDRLSV